MAVSEDNENFIYMMIGTGIVIMLGLTLTIIVFFIRSQRKMFEKQMQLQRLELTHKEQLLYSTITTQEEERKRIAKDLHDEVGSKLNVIHLNLFRLKKVASTPELATTVTEIFTVINEAINTTRRIAHDLLPPTLESFGLKEAIKELCDSYLNVEGVTFRFEVMQHEDRKIDKVVEVNIFRVIQELVSNSLKHAAASEISIRLALSSSALRLEYRDNGKGFDNTLLKRKHGLGMYNIDSRMSMIKATFHLESQPNKGVFATLNYTFP
jgi:signal transduction histidine kinase